MRRRVKVLTVIAAVLLGCPVLLVLLIQTSAFKSRLLTFVESYLSENYKIKVEAKSLNYNLYPLSIRVDGFHLYGGRSNEASFLRASNVQINLPYSAIWSDDVVIHSLVLDTPAIQPENLPNPDLPEKKEDTGTFRIEKIILTGGALTYSKFQLHDLKMDAQLEPNSIRLNSIYAKMDEMELTADGRVEDLSKTVYKFRYRVRGPAAAVSRLFPQVPPLTGEIRASGQAYGEAGGYKVDGVLNADAISVKGDGNIVANAQYKIDSTSTESPYQIHLTWKNLPLGLANTFAGDLPSITSMSNGNMDYYGTEDFWKGSGYLKMTLAQTGSRGLEPAGVLEGKLQGGAFQLEPTDIRIASSTIHLGGSLSDSSINMDVDAIIPRPSDFAALSPRLKSIPGSYRIESNLRGPYRNILVEASVHGESKELQLDATGSYALGAEKIQVNFLVDAQGQSINRFYPKAGMQGVLHIEGNATGIISHPVLAAKIQGTDLQTQNVVIGDLAADVNSDGKTVRMDAKFADYSTSAQATYRYVDHAYTLQADLNELKLEQFSSMLPPSAQGLTGVLSANIKANGNISRWQNSSAGVFIRNASFQREELKASIKEGSSFRLQSRKIQVDAGVLLTDGSLSIQGTVPLEERAAMDLRATGQADLKMLSLVTTKAEATGIVYVDLSLQGSRLHPAYNGSVRSENFSAALVPDGPKLAQANLQAQLSGEQLGIDTSGILNGSELKLKASIPLTEKPGEIHVSLDSFSLATLTSDSKVQGEVDLLVDARGTGIKPANWSGDLSITPSNLVVSGKEISADRPIRIHMDTGKAELMPVHLTAEEFLDIAAQGGVNFKTGEIHAKVRGATDLVILSTFTDSMQASGKLTADVDLGGNLTNPLFQGMVRVNEGVLRMIDSPILLERVELEAAVEKERIRIAKFTAEMGGGELKAGGEIILSNWAPESINITVNAKNVGTNYPEDLRSQMNADLVFTGSGQDYLLKGGIDIIRSTYREDIDPRARLVNTLLSEKEALSADTSSRSHLKLDLRVRSLGDFQMNNNLGKIQAGSDLKVTGSLYQPRVSGRIRVRERSRFFFEGNEFEVQRGTVDFYGTRTITPVLDVQLYAVVTDDNTKDEYEITIPLSGPIDDLDDRDPMSSPALDPNQIYFLLLTGRVDAQLSRASSRFFQQQLASYLAGQMFSDVQKKLARAFGLERVEIQPELISSETKPGAKMVLGKDFSSSLSLVYSVSLTDSEEQTWVAKYRIRRNLDVRFVDQDDGTYTANLRHAVRFGRGSTLQSLYRNIPKVPLKKIRSIQLENHSELPDSEVTDRLKIKAGDTYDFWKLQDRTERLKQDLQDAGYLFAAVRIQETDVSTSEISLNIEVNPRNRGEMIFSGSEVSKKQIDEYKTLWREGFSEEAVLELIRGDLLRQNRLKGYHQVAVNRKTETANGISRYHFEIIPGTLYDQPNIVYKGAQQYTAEDLAKDMKPLYKSSDEMYTEAIHNFPAFQRKVLALFVKKGFLETTIESGPVRYEEKGIVEKEVEIAEGSRSRIADIEITGDDGFPVDLQEKLKLHVGSVYDSQAFAEDELTISEYYEQRGYRNFRMESETRKEDHSPNLILSYRLNTGGVAKIASIRINGNAQTDRSVIEKRLGLKEGDAITHEKLANAQKNLYDLRIFHQATVQAKETSIPNQYDVDVDVTEMKHYEFVYGIRYDTEKGIGVETQLSDLSLFGTAESLSLYARANRANQLFRTVFHSPTLSGLKWKTLLSASYETGELLLRETNGFGLAEGQRYDFSFQRQRNVWKPFILLTSYTFESLNIRPLATPETPFDAFKISRVGATFLADTRDDPLNARRGKFVSLDFQYAPKFFASDVSYGKSYLQYYQFRPVKNMIWASAIRAGFATSLGPRLITERFLAGGSYTIRGFEKDRVGPMDAFGNPIGGEALLIINQELRFPIYKWFGGAVFYDGGNVYNKWRDFNPLDLRHSVGFGLRFDSPFGVARLDLGFNLFPEDGEPRRVIHFGLGQTF